MPRCFKRKKKLPEPLVVRNVAGNNRKLDWHSSTPLPGHDYPSMFNSSHISLIGALGVAT